MAMDNRQASLNTIRTVGSWGMFIGVIVIAFANLVVCFLPAPADEKRHIAEEVELCRFVMLFTGLIIVTAILYATSLICESIRATKL